MKKMFTRIAVTVMVIMVAVAFAGCGSAEPKTLEEYIDQNADARAEVEEAVNLQSNDDIDVSVAYDGNNATITCQLKATYDEDMLDSIAKAYEGQAVNIENSIATAIHEIEESTGITDVSMDVVIRNGDGNEIWKKHFEGS